MHSVDMAAMRGELEKLALNRWEQDPDDPEHQRFVVLGPPTGIVTLDGGYGRFKVVLDGENNDRVLRPIEDAVQSARLVSVDDAIEKLNALVQHDRDAVHQLCETRVPVAPVKGE